MGKTLEVRDITGAGRAAPKNYDDFLELPIFSSGDVSYAAQRSGTFKNVEESLD